MSVGIGGMPTGATRLFPIIGDPIEFVESPTRLTRAFAERGVDAACVPMRVPESHLGSVWAGLTATANVDGILVTMPFKFAAFDRCATTSERARALGVVSLARRNADGSWHGEMLDGLSFVAAQERNGAVVEGARALLFGAGGAGRAIALALLAARVSELVVHDSDGARAEALVQLAAATGASGRCRPGGADPNGFDLVLNATPSGMSPDDPLPLDATLLTPDMFVGDVIAGHGVTRLITAAQRAGCRTAGGSEMVRAGVDLMADFLLGGRRLG